MAGVDSDQVSSIPPTRRTRTRTGCATCRKRRVKCDENRPACQKCVGTGRVCEGYGIAGGGNANNVRVMTTTTSSHHSPTTYLPHRLSEALSRQELDAFDFFRRYMTIKLPGVFESEFWGRLTLQASAQEPAVLQAIIALSAAQRNEASLTLKAYNMAIHHLQVHLQRQDRYSIRLTLITCMLFVCLEFLKGSVATGDVHLQNGLRLLQLLRNRDGQGSYNEPGRAVALKSHTEAVDDSLLEAFTRLNVLSSLFGHGSRHLYQLAWNVRCSPDYDDSLKFHSLAEARQHLDHLINGTYALSVRADTLENRRGSYPQSYRSRQSKLQDALCHWLRGFEHSLSSLKAEEDLQTAWAISLLYLYHTMADIMLATCLRGRDENMYDHYSDRFASLLLQVKGLWDSVAAQLRGEMPTGPFQMPEMSFTIDMGFIPPLYYTAIKCRVPGIRRSAIKLLTNSPHIEGAWDGKLVASVAQRIMDMEERGMYENINLPEADTRLEVWGEGILTVPPFSRIGTVHVTSDTGTRHEATIVTKMFVPGARVGEWKVQSSGLNVTVESRSTDQSSLMVPNWSPST